jgi:protocatechuate 3,4-dioxygenase beta subunit
MPMSRASLVLLAVLQVTPAVTQEPAPTGEIRGRITDGETGQPLPRAWVRLHTRDGGERWSTRTDEAGQYRFTGLAAGEYSGIVDAGPSRSTHSMAFLSAGVGRPIALKEGETREHDVPLRRTYAIDARVVDEWGDPLSGVRVSALSTESGRPTSLLWNHNASTDDHGRQRVFGLEPGRYVVCAESSIAGVSVGGRGDALLRTCHPSAVHESEAQVVRVARSDVGEIEIRMRRGRTFTISGRVVDASGAPAPGTHLVLAQHRLGGSTGMLQTVDAEGRFRITNVLPGEYAIEASIGGPDRPEQRRPLERAFRPVRVDTTDVSELSVTLQKTVTVIGRVTLEDPAASFVRAPGYGPVSVYAGLVDGTGVGSRSLLSAPVGDNRSFTMTSVFGRRTLDVVNLPRGWYVRSIRYAGREIIDEPTTFKDSGGEPTVDVVLSKRGAVVVGRAIDEAGNAVGRAVVLMFPADAAPMSWRLPAETRASAAGQFRAGPVRAGEYSIVAVPASARPIQLGEPARLARLAAAAERITLGEFEERTVDVRVVAEQ